jgi:hypothetical protein
MFSDRFTVCEYLHTTCIKLSYTEGFHMFLSCILFFGAIVSESLFKRRRKNERIRNEWKSFIKASLLVKQRIFAVAEFVGNNCKKLFHKPFKKDQPELNYKFY